MSRVHLAAATRTAQRAAARHRHRPPNAEQRLLDVQRRAGNKAACALVAGNAPPSVQRSIGISAADLAKLRTGNTLQRAFASSTYDKLVALRKKYDKFRDQPNKLFLADAIAGVCDHWLATHGKSPSKADQRRKPIVEDLQAHALRAASKIRAEMIYMKDLEGGGLKGITRTTKSASVEPAKALAAGRATPKTPGVEGADEKAAALATQFNLTAGELTAIRVYTVSDYGYINPATANSDSWMEHNKQNALDGTALKSVDGKVLKEEGVLHAGMAMQGLTKLPPWKGLTYRGSRMDPASFADDYYRGATITFGAFGSSAKNESAAREFANGTGGDVAPGKNQTVSVLMHVTLTNGRDIAALSAALSKIGKAKEDEVLILPGATFQVVDIDLRTTGDPGNKAAPATSWATVYMTQVK